MRRCYDGRENGFELVHTGSELQDPACVARRQIHRSCTVADGATLKLVKMVYLIHVK